MESTTHEDLPATGTALARKVALCVASTHAERYASNSEFRAAIDAADGALTDDDVIAILVRRLADATHTTETLRNAVTVASRTGLRY